MLPLRLNKWKFGVFPRTFGQGEHGVGKGSEPSAIREETTDQEEKKGRQRVISLERKNGGDPEEIGTLDDGHPRTNSGCAETILKDSAFIRKILANRRNKVICY